MNTHVERDERTTSIENAGYRLSYLFLSFGLLAIIAVRSFRDGQNSWDLFALVVLGGVLNMGYLRYHRAVYRRGVVSIAIALIGAALIAVAIAFLRRQT